MKNQHKHWVLAAAVAAALALPMTAAAQSDNDSDSAKLAQQIAVMQKRMDQMQQQLQAMREQQSELKDKQLETAKTQKVVVEKQKKQKKLVDKVADGIKVGGAMRFQYSYEDYNKGNERRVGDTDFDIFRLNFSGKVDNIELKAEWRWFQYMSAIKYAWLGYDFDDHQQLQLGITRIPFGNQPYNSHNYFFSSNYYLGLEDTYHAGAEYVYKGGPWNVQLAFFKNDAEGGVDSGASSRANSYSYNVVGVRGPGEGTYANPQHSAGSVDTAAARVAYTFKPTGDLKWEVGGSALHGGLDSPDERIGSYSAFALHTNVDYKRWNFQAEAARYDYTTDSNAKLLAVGAYAFYDTIPAAANSYTLNVKYHYPVSWGPIHSLDFYNDYSLVTNKTAALPSTFMNVTGVGVSAGDLYTYFDFVTGRNQPFIGGSMAGDGQVEHRFNINFGFYF
ncbi:porin [Oleiagrimonas sp. C23AA]|uniref:porin n=1 Tax=Oleiagrimonas sp. C23AA TaxID=2719047 RepID=UPI0014235B10|nr:porin [Oleiagrimonas sp. C23AA]NII11783.1 carbohydrate porin [Oleiagrimonas sp. C23AA]